MAQVCYFTHARTHTERGIDLLLLPYVCRDCIGDNVLSGDSRWAGTYGVNLDFVARSHCAVEFISIEAMQVCTEEARK